MNKLSSFLKLKGEGVFKEKMRYTQNRLKGNPTFMGDTLEKDIVVDSGYGFFYVREHSVDLHIISASYEYKTIKVFEKLARESKIIVDVGSNIGKYTILAGIINPNAKIIAIEPEPSNYWITHKNIELNNLWNNMRLIKLAVGNKKGEMKMHISDRNNAGHSMNEKLVNKTKGKGYNSFISVEVDTLDNLFDSIDLLKVDTEGFELEVLKGAKRLLTEKKIKKMVIEIDDSNLKVAKRLLNKYGYQIDEIEVGNYLVELK